uniref:Uncharacterized protein n=1 Tax=Brassica oleracea var. oleracea TaxID=109376 RepID=A0A0D3A907_BRAOL
MPLSKEHCKEICIISSVHDLFDKVSSNDIKRSGLDHLEKSFELDLQQLIFCSRKSFNSFVFKENSFSLSSYRYALITGNLFASTCALDEFMVKILLEHKSLRAKTDFCCDSVLKSDLELKLLCSESDQVRHVLKMFYGTVLSHAMTPCHDTILDKQDQSPKGVRYRSRDRAYQFEIWRCMYSRKPSSKLQGSKIDLRTNSFEEGEYDVPRSEHQPVWFMDTAQGGVLVYQLDQTELARMNLDSRLMVTLTSLPQNQSL